MYQILYLLDSDDWKHQAYDEDNEHLDLRQMYNRMTLMKRASLDVQMQDLDAAESTSMITSTSCKLCSRRCLKQGKEISHKDMAVILMSQGNYIHPWSCLGGNRHDMGEELVQMVLDQGREVQEHLSPNRLTTWPQRQRQERPCNDRN